jgi:hypothetical protein
VYVICKDFIVDVTKYINDDNLSNYKIDLILRRRKNLNNNNNKHNKYRMTGMAQITSYSHYTITV